MATTTTNYTILKKFGNSPDDYGLFVEVYKKVQDSLAKYRTAVSDYGLNVQLQIVSSTGERGSSEPPYSIIAFSTNKSDIAMLKLVCSEV